MLNIYRVDSNGITMEALEELADDNSVYSIYYYKGYKVADQIITEPGYRMKPFGSHFKTLTAIQKENILWSIQQGKVLLVWALEEE